MTAVQERPSEAQQEPARKRRYAALARPRLPRAPRERSTTAIVVGWATALLSVFAAWFVLYVLVLSPLQARHDQQVLYSKFRQQLSQELAPIGGLIPADAPVALMSMPAIGMKLTKSSSKARHRAT